MEKRILSGTHELRANKTDGKMSVSGYAARYNVLSHVIKPLGFKERIAPGAFDRILATKPDVVATFNHDMSAVLGRTTSGTLRLNADKVGLAFALDLPNTSIGRDVYESVQRRDLNEMSFAFACGERDADFAEEDEDDEHEFEHDKYRSLKRKAKQIVRTIKNFTSLLDISVVTKAAYPFTSVDARQELVSAECRSAVEAFRKPAHKPWADRFPKGRPDILNVDEAASIRRRRRNLMDQI